MFPFTVHTTSDGVQVNGRSIVTRSLSPEAQHHVRIVVGANDHLSEDDLQWAMQAIPEVATERRVNEARDHDLHGFTVIVEPLTSEPGGTAEINLVRATDIGEAVREELFNAFCLL